MDNSHATKSCVLILLVVLLCAERVQGLECYQCFDVPPETSCNTTTCPYPDGRCVIQMIEIIEDSQRKKAKNNYCFSICPTNKYFKILGATVNVKSFCCEKDLCNAGGATGSSS
ncbi:lymphocyte antigen 6A-2/6E-1-like [Mus caroli]|uniref:Lymphocyte antigen 6A-2/6E-1-like n=1 Tax=Mus caroli TaxID=10089 RepID=A0A6P5P5W3_MUSCR|nr:lymphocyte antigen 6A-2/6E-1-like [Mus caroli]